jgi:hypothetical protein
LIAATGTATGTAVTKLIGMAGGTFVSADGRLTIDFPTGALDHDEMISIQPIGNTATGAAGVAYRITPHLNFTAPVKDQF